MSVTMLAAAAQATRRLRIGCLVSSNTFRHPALLAKMAATLDHISAGRLVLALGAGWHEEIPVGTASHVREVVERYADLGVSAIIFPTPAPWDKEGFRYLDESVIRTFEGGSS